MAARYQSQILAQIREGKRFWSWAEIGRDLEAFRWEVVEPLRQLKYVGVIPALSEIEATIAGQERITGIEIIGGINGLLKEGDDYPARVRPRRCA